MRLSRQSIRLAARTLAKHPGFATTAILSLGIAIALNTTMYGVLDAMLNPRIDIRRPEQLSYVAYFGDYQHKLDRDAITASLRSSDTFEAITGAAFFGMDQPIETDKRYSDARVQTVLPNYFDVLGVRALRGRLFTEADRAADTPPVVLDEELAAELFIDNQSPLGQRVHIEGRPFVVIGVLARTAHFGGTAAWVINPPVTQRVAQNMVRLRDTITRKQAEREMARLSAQLAAATGEDARTTGLRLIGMFRRQFRVQGFHLGLIAAVLAVLLVACANLANLQLARGIGRARELALRSALGASRADIVTELLIESGLLAVAGLALGVVLTIWAKHLLRASLVSAVGYYVVSPQLSWRVFLFAVVVCLLCLTLVGLLPAIRVSRVDPSELLKAGAGTGAHKTNRRRYGFLVAAEIALSLALLSGAALVIRAAWRYEQIDFGYDPKPLVNGWTRVQPPLAASVSTAGALNNLVTRARAVPDIADAAAAVQASPLKRAVTVDDPGGAMREIPAPMWTYQIVTPGYFRTLGLPLVKGRDFAEGGHAELSVIVDQPTARLLWPNADPIGRMVKFGDAYSTAPYARVVGVVPEMRDLREMRIFKFARPARLNGVFRVAAVSDSVAVGKFGAQFNVVVRARRNPERVLIETRRLLRETPFANAARADPAEDVLGLTGERTSQRFVASLFTFFAALALTLAALGIYGVVRHSVEERRREMGVRIALGAGARDILHAILREGNVIALSGIAVGLYATKRSVPWLAAFYGEDDQYDAHVFALMAVILFGVTVVAALLPALRATRIDPVEAMRSE
jgi:putative ABC transport system permease protein